MACARTVAVVVPSPATSLVLLATSRTIWARLFSRPSFSSISLATVTPSLVMVGETNFFSMTTLRPLGPSVTFTASASTLTPRRIACRDSSPCTICFAIAFLLLVFETRCFETQSFSVPHISLVVGDVGLFRCPTQAKGRLEWGSWVPHPWPVFGQGWGRPYLRDAAASRSLCFAAPCRIPRDRKSTRLNS